MIRDFECLDGVEGGVIADRESRDGAISEWGGVSAVRGGVSKGGGVRETGDGVRERGGVGDGSTQALSCSGEDSDDELSVLGLLCGVCCPAV